LTYAPKRRECYKPVIRLGGPVEALVSRRLTVLIRLLLAWWSEATDRALDALDGLDD
jgi:hypothetical protein